MKKVSLNNKEYNIPESWYDITIKDFQKISKLYNTENKSEEDDFKTNLNKKFNTLSIYTGISLKQLKQGNVNEINNITSIMKFITEDIPEKQITEFEFNGNKYNVLQGLSSQQFQDYISLENVLQHSNSNDMLHYILAIVSRKSVDETLDDYDVDKRAEEFLNLDIVKAHNVSLFFSALNKVYNINGIIYSNPQKLIEMKSKEVQANFSKLQDGKGWFMNFVIGILRRLTIYLENRAMKYFQSYPQEQLKQTLSTKNIFVRSLRKIINYKKNNKS